MDNRKKFGILSGTNKRIFTHSGEIAIPNSGVQDDHTPFERKGMNENNDIVILPLPNILLTLE